MVVRVNVYQTEELTEANGRTAEQVIRRYLMNAFDKAGYESEIHIGFEPISVATQEPYCGDDSVYNEWYPTISEANVPVAKDSNLLLTAHDGSGCGSVGGNVAVAGVGRVTRNIDYNESGFGNIYDDIETAMHEVAHNLGFTHDHDDDKPGKQHLGMAWNEPTTFFGFDLSWLLGGTWHRTPCVTEDDVENACGEYIPEQKHNRVEREMYYHTCAIERFEIQ